MAKFYKCAHCTNLFATIIDSGVTPECCGQPMVLLEAGAVDAAVEKHVPVIEKSEGKVKVKVGSVEHPMTDEHYIQFIALEVPAANALELVTLSPTDKPEVTFPVCDSSFDVVAYEYCNLHGLWKAEG